VTYTQDISIEQARAQHCTRLAGDAETSASSVPAQPTGPKANWTRFYLTNGCTHYWDRSTASTKGKFRKAWFLQSCPDPRKLGFNEYDKSAVFLNYANCQETSLLTVRITPYADEYGHGKPGVSVDYAVVPSAFREAVPNTLGDHMLKLMCPAKATK
jgi:hypothetical protein